jgi:hypothetical protein
VSVLGLGQLTIHTAAQEGIRLTTTSGSHTNVEISKTTLHHTGTAGTAAAIAVGTGTGTLVRNALLYSNYQWVRVLTGAVGPQVQHVTVAKSAGVGLQCDSGASGVTFTNNISYLNGTDAISNGCGATLLTNVTTNPNFTNSAGDVYTLARPSVAIDQGTPVPGLTEDVAGNPRPQGGAWDSGAYEAPAVVGGAETGRLSGQSMFLLY